MWKGLEAFSSSVKLLNAVNGCCVEAQLASVYDDSRHFIHPFVKKDSMDSWTSATKKGHTQKVGGIYQLILTIIALFSLKTYTFYASLFAISGSK
jgi:hypothetical protein